MTDIWAIILAGGQSRRMGEPKLLLPAQEGSILEQTVHRTLAAGNCRVAWVADRNGPLKQKDLGELPVQFIESDRSSQGIGATLSAGVEGLILLHSPRALIVLLGDQPEMRSDVIRQVAEVYMETGSLIVQARYANCAAHPVLFAAALFPELLALTGDTGAKEVLRKYRKQIVYVDIAEPAPDDIDTPEEYRKYLLSVGRTPRLE